MPGLDQDRYQIAAQEDRSGYRNRTSVPASLRASGGRAFQTVVRDLSVSGFSATAISFIHPSTRCWLTLPGLDSQAARVVWWDDGVVGCAFEDLLDPDLFEGVLERWQNRGGMPAGR
ncbi:PilZ domain-containing protein [Novosphingobium colocasiae]|uniref:PilZ domain-containing protein n=1 Tax=Novosphingobium colocasiae TaxID=1256513 RepID=UPI0035B2414B